VVAKKKTSVALLVFNPLWHKPSDLHTYLHHFLHLSSSKHTPLMYSRTPRNSELEGDPPMRQHTYGPSEDQEETDRSSVGQKETDRSSGLEETDRFSGQEETDRSSGHELGQLPASRNIVFALADNSSSARFSVEDSAAEVSTDTESSSSERTGGHSEQIVSSRAPEPVTAQDSERPRLDEEDEEEVPVISVEAEERMEEITRVEKEAQQEQEQDEEAFTVSSGSRYGDDSHLPHLRGSNITDQFRDTFDIDQKRLLRWECTLATI
jgi:hypothetical protein